MTPLNLFRQAFTLWEKTTSATFDSLLRSPLYLTASGSGLSGFLHFKRWADASRDTFLASLGLATRQDQLKTLHLLHQLEGRLEDLQFDLERPDEKPTEVSPGQG